MKSKEVSHTITWSSVHDCLQHGKMRPGLRQSLNTTKKFSAKKLKNNTWVVFNSFQILDKRVNTWRKQRFTQPCHKITPSCKFFWHTECKQSKLCFWECLLFKISGAKIVVMNFKMSKGKYFLENRYNMPNLLAINLNPNIAWKAFGYRWTFQKVDKIFQSFNFEWTLNRPNSRLFWPVDM